MKAPFGEWLFRRWVEEAAIDEPTAAPTAALAMLERRRLEPKLEREIDLDRRLVICGIVFPSESFSFR